MLHFLSKIKKKDVSLALGSRHLFFACFDLLGSKVRCVRCVCTISDNLDVKNIFQRRLALQTPLIEVITVFTYSLFKSFPFFYSLTGSPLREQYPVILIFYIIALCVLTVIFLVISHVSRYKMCIIMLY